MLLSLARRSGTALFVPLRVPLPACAVSSRSLSKKAKKKGGKQSAAPSESSSAGAEGETAGGLPDMEEFKKALGNVTDTLKVKYSTMRSGRPSPALLEGIRVSVYGEMMPLKQVGQVVVRNATLMVVNVYDQQVTASVEKAIRESNLNLNPTQEDANIVHVPIPKLSKDSRLNLVKVAHEEKEHSKVVARKVRKDAMDAIKKCKKTVSEDEIFRAEKEVDKLVHAEVEVLEGLFEHKKKDILEA